MLRAIGFVILLPPLIMSISFLLEGKMPLMWGPVLFTIGFLLLGYRGHIFFDTQSTKTTVEKRTWGIPFYKKHFDRNEIDGEALLEVSIALIAFESSHVGAILQWNVECAREM